MGYVVKSMYKQALAQYNIANKEGYRVATLMNYDGQQQNRPPARFIVVDDNSCCRYLLQQSTLTDDIQQYIIEKESADVPDPLFPPKEHRQPVDQLV